jgi:hypothetical protein
VKRALRILSLALAGFVAVLWLRVLTTHQRDYLELPRTADHRDYLEGRRHERRQWLLLSDRRGIVFDMFRRQLPPEKAPGPAGSEGTQRWLQPRAERTAKAYVRHLGFEKGLEHRHGQYGDEPLYFYGTDYYVAVPHWLLIVLFLLPVLWPLRHHWPRRKDAVPKSGENPLTP